MLIPQFLADVARRTPDAVALIEARGTLTYGELDRLANRYAHLLIEAGVRRRDRVLLALESSGEWVGAYLGAMRAGAVVVPLAAGPRNDRLERVLADCTPRVSIVDAATAADYGGVLSAAGPMFVQVRPGATAPAGTDLAAALERASDQPPGLRLIDLDLAAIIYTSGSTGVPRGVMLTHRNLVSNARSIVQYLGLTASDRVVCVLPFYYVYGLSLLHTHLAAGASIVLETRFAFPSLALDAIQNHRATGFAGVPSTFALLMSRVNFSAYDLSSLRYVTQAGGPMPPQRILDWLEVLPGVPFYVMYGATEAGARLTYLPPEALRAKLGSVGRPIPNVDIVVVRDDGTEAEVGEVGELVARGSNIALGYWNAPDDSSERFDARGYRTGDLGYKDPDGFLFLIGRRHDIIKAGAHRVGAREIEDVIATYPSVLEVAVIPAPHEILGEAPVAIVSMRESDPQSADGIRRHCSAQLPSHKVPVQVHVVPELPRLTGSGKIDKLELRRRYAADPETSAAPARAGA